MNNILKYKDYIGSVEYSGPDRILHGKVLGIDALISYEGVTKEELEDDFRGAVDDYLDLCTEQGITPEKSCDGHMSITVSPEIHRLATDFAFKNNISLSKYIENLLTSSLKG